MHRQCPVYVALSSLPDTFLLTERSSCAHADADAGSNLLDATQRDRGLRAWDERSFEHDMQRLLEHRRVERNIAHHRVM